MIDEFLSCYYYYLTFFLEILIYFFNIDIDMLIYYRYRYRYALYKGILRGIRNLTLGSFKQSATVSMQ